MARKKPSKKSEAVSYVNLDRDLAVHSYDTKDEAQKCQNDDRIALIEITTTARIIE